MASRYQDLLNIYTQSNPILNTKLFDTSDMAQTKAAEVERASAAKQAEANGSPNGYNLATMRATGSGVASAKPMDRDFVTLSPFQFELKYGANARAQYAAAEASGESARRAGTQATRDGAQILGDSVNSAVMGFANAFGGIGALGVGLIDDESGAWVSTKLGQLNQFSQSLQSRELNASRAAYGSQNELDAADNKAEAEQVTKDYGKIAGGTYRFLNDAYDSLGNALKDPNMATDTVASGVGSLFAGGPLSKGLRAIGTATIGRLGASEAIAAAASRAAQGRYLGTSERLLLGAAEHAPMTAAIGLMEGGGAYQQTVDQSYQELIAQGVAPEEAARRANAAGLEAAAIQTPIAAATGRLVSRFEGHPTRVGSLSSAAGNMIRETVEETAQSAAGQVAQNVGMRDNVNPNQDLLEGVGEQAALGGLGGLGSAGLAQAPGIAFRASVETAKLPFKALGAGLKYQADRVRANNQKVQDQLLSGLYDQADQAVPDAQAEMEQVIANANPSVAEDLGRWAGEQVNRLQQSKAIQAAAQTVMAKGGAVKDKLASYFQVRDGVQEMQAAQDEATPAGAENTTMQSIKDAAVNVTQSQAVQDSLAKGKQMVKSAAGAINANVRAALGKMTASQNNTPDTEGAANLNEQAQMMAGVAAESPELVDTKAAEQVLYHDSQGTIALSAPQRNALRTAVAAGKAAQSGSELASTFGLSDADAVSRQVLTDKPKEGSNLSLNGHLQGIASAYNSGDLQLASQRLTDLRRFAQHLSNKVVSFNDALTGGNTNENNAVSFPALVNGRFIPNSGKTYLQPRSARSVQLAQEVAVQARTVADAVNNLSDAFPDLGIEHIEPAVLDASLSGKAETVANEYRNGQRTVPNSETKGVQSETAKPAQASEVAEPETATVDKQAATDSQLNADQATSEQSTDETTPPPPTSTPKTEEQNLVERYNLRPVQAVSESLHSHVVSEISALAGKLGGIGKDVPVYVGDDAAFAQFGESIMAQVMYTANGGILVLSQKMIDDIAEGRVGKLKLQRLLAHEMGHVVDQMAARGGRRYSNAAIFDESRKHYKAFKDAIEGLEEGRLHPAYRPQFGYIESHKGQDFNQEFMAELFAFAVNNPMLAQEIMPSLFNEVETMVERAGGNLMEMKTNGKDFNDNPALRGDEAPSSSEDQGRSTDRAEERAAEPFEDGEVVYWTGSKGGKTKALFTGYVESESRKGEFATVKIEGKTTVVPVSELEHMPSRLEEAHPNLVGGKNNRFMAAFRVAKKASSRIMDSDSPLQTIRDAFKSKEALEELIGSKLNRDYSVEVSKAYTNFLKLGDGLKTIMEERLQSALKAKLDRGLKLEDMVSFLEGGALNAVIQNEDGSYSYDPKLLEAATLAGLQWYLKMNKNGTQLDDNDIRQMYGLPDTVPLPDGLAAMLSEGMGDTEVSRSLATEIGRFWGMDINPNAPANYAQSVLEGMAKELIESMVAGGLIQETQVDTKDVLNVPHVSRYSPVLTEEVVRADGSTYTKRKGPALDEETLAGLRQFPAAIEKAALIDGEEVNYVGEKPGDRNSKTQLRNPMVETTDQQRQVIAKEQATEHRMNMPFVGMLTRLGEGLTMRLFGGGDTNGPLNVNDRRSLEGRNLTVQSAFRSIFNLMAEVQNRSDLDKVDPSEMPVFFDYAYTAVNRLQMLGKDNPQSNKLMREAVLPTWKVMDLTDPDMRLAFSMGLAQALGIKVHQNSQRQTLKDLTKKLAQFPKTLELLRDDGELSEADVDTMKAEGVDSPVALHALMEYTRLTDTAPADRKAFRSALYFEADGVTNGVVNAMALFSSKDFTDTWLSNIERGGLWIGEQAASLFNLRSRGNGNELDLYGVAASNTSNYLTDLLRRNASDPAVSAKLTMVNAFLVQYLKDVDMDGDKLLLKRDVVKNPLTITVYGSGTNGIAGNLMDEALSKLYSDLSAAAGRMAGDKNLTLAEAMFPEMNKAKATQSLKGLEALLSQLTGSTLGVSEKSLYNEENSNPNVTIADPVEFTLSSAQKQALQKNILHAFAEPMVQGITQTVGADLIDSMGTIKTQTQVWSLVGQFMFQNEYEKALAAKRKANPNMNSYELLSQSETDAIMKKISANLPSFGTGTQNFMFGMKQRLDLPFMTSKNGKPLKLEFSRSLTDNMQTPAFGYMPGDAGVSGQPGLTIGSGDGQAVQNIIMNPETPAERLQIFDGIHSSVADMATMGRVSNQGVYDSWANNPMRSLAEAFDTFVKQVDLSGLNERQRTALFRAISGRQGIDADTNTLMSLLRREAATGLNKAKGIDERQAVLKVLQLSVDQMAGAAAPYTRKGIILSGSHAERAAQLNILKSQMAKGAVPEATQSESAPQTSNVAEEAPKPSTAARGADVKLFTKGMDRYITKLTSDPTTRALLRDVIRSGKVDAYKVWTGSREELIRHAADMGISIPADRQKTFMGFTDPVSKQLFVVDGNAETMLHELIHAATYETVAAHYAGESVSPEASAAIERIEQLMSQFREANLDGDAYQNALDEMDRQADAGNQAAELNEFMAWALSNQDLAEQLKGTQVENRYLLLAKKAVQALKALLWGGKRSAAVKDDVFTNLRFNTNIIMRAGRSSDMARQGLLFHDPSFGDNQRVLDLLGNIKAKVSDFVGEDAVRRVVNSAQARQSLANGARIMKAFTEAGFDMTKQEQMAFMHMVGIMGTAADLDANSTARMQDIYTHAIKNLSLGDFLQNPGENDPADNYQANRKLSLLAGKFAAREDALDRSSILPAFVALAQTNDEFRQILSKMDMPKGQYEAWNSVDGILDNLGDIAMDTVGRAVSGEGVLSKNTQQALDNLTMQMLETNEDAEWFIERFTKPVGSFTDRVNDGLTNLFQKAGEGAQNLVTKAKKDPNAKVKIALAQTLQTVTGMLHEQTGQEVSMSLMSAANQSNGIWKPFYDLLKDLIGRTAENAGVYDLIKLARYHVSSLRQQYVENLPNIINSKFSTPLTAEQQEHMHRGLAQTDLASMLVGNKIEDVLRWVKSASARQSKINELADTIRGLAPDQAKLMLAKSDQLAGWMVSKSTGSNLLRNADAIAHLLGEGVQVADPTPELVQAIDHYVSMKALDMQPTRTRNALEVLAGKESDGLNFVLNLLRGQRMIDDAKSNGNARFNHYKGFMTAAPADGVSLIVAHDNEAASLLEKSYVRIGAFKGSEKDPSAKGRSYWMAPVSGKAPYSQGIAQNVHQTVGGVDHASGFTQGLTGGVITDPKLVARIAKAGTNETNGQALLPVYDKQGKLYAYERQVDPAMTARLKPDLNLASMMGQRSGRQMEEAAAFQINKLLVDNLRDMWDRDKGKAGRRNEYVNLLESTDPVVRDSVAIFSNEMRDYITDRFPEGFMVRKDMIDDAIGYRNASIGDAWTGTSRWSPETQQLVKNALMSIFGNKAYAHAVRAERFLQNAIVQDLRTIIVIRSVVVPVGNAASNIYQLISRGVPVVPMIRSIPKKISEIESWHKTRLRQMEAEAELLAETDPFKRQKLEAEIKGITDSHKRLTIWPLLEAGEFSSISDAGSREDVLLSEGKLSDYLEAAVDKLPPAVRTMGKYAIISKDTALFRALQKTVDYGDFVGKAILYDDLTKRKKMTSAEALAQITEEFVNYDRLPGRDRQYLESIGLLWFWNFKVRSAKVAMSMIRNNPVHALMAANLPTPITGIGLPLEDNLLASIFDGRVANSIGLHMAFRAPGLLPIGNFLG